MRYTYRNWTCECSLKYQKSAEAIVPDTSRVSGKGRIIYGELPLRVRNTR
ncbi:hypothetical protein J11TS1_16030 [Oceanobacillus sp. J11TS1]|nr:hypothetical protein J11TS1_16030 [Oceanobacillus sp. J11TS1]